MVVLELPNSLSKCPIPWIKFITEGCHEAPRVRYDDISPDFINAELSLFNARLDEDSAQCRVEFDDDSGWLAFLLRWS